MNRFKFEAFLKEFPFLEKCNTRWDDQQRNSLNCDGIKVSRVDHELLNYTPQYSGATGSLVSIDDGERFDFILKNGEWIKDAVESEGYITHNEAHTDNESMTGETILEAIFELDVASEIEYIVKIAYGYNIRNDRSLSNYEITIYKPPKKFSISDIIRDAQKKALLEVQAESNF